MPVIITIAHSTVTPLGIPLPPSIDVTIVPSYSDSERVDMTLTVEQPDHTRVEEVFKDVAVVIRDGIPRALISFMMQKNPEGVPTVEAREKGGKKEASHSYK